jgi:Porin PorA
MRRIIGLTLAVLGVLLIAAAVSLPTWVTSMVVKFPLDEHQTAVLTASNASYFSQKALKERTGVTISATYTITGDPGKGSSSVAVWNQVSTVTDVTNHEQISQTTRTFAFDRRTAQLVDCCGASVNGDKSVHQTGMLGYVFPFGTQKQTYQVYDTTLKRTAPFTYTGSSTVNGIPVYVFTQDVAPTQVATLPIPGALLGLKAAVVTMGEFDQQHQVYYVDPQTGALVNVTEHQVVTLRDPATRAVAKVLYDADLSVTPETLKTVTALDSSGRDTLELLTTILPITFGVAGGVALVAGIFLARGRRGAERSADGTQVSAAAAGSQAPGEH